MKDNSKLNIFEFNTESDINIKKDESNYEDSDNQKDSAHSKLNNNDDFAEIEENHYSENNKKITLKEKISFFAYIFIGIILSLHSTHFVFSEYVRSTNNLLFSSFLFVFIYYALLPYPNYFL